MSERDGRGLTLAQSTPPRVARRARPDGPNVVIIVLDDTGFAQLGCFGSDIETPNIDRLADDGLRYHRFHVTALCSPTRACILTGRNHHAVGMGFLTDMPTGYPGYNGRLPTSAAALPRVLRDAGYNTMAVGKWHLVPRWELTASGPFDRWPLGVGFERYYGFLAGRHQPVLAQPRPQQRLRRAAPLARRGLPPHRGPRRPGHRDDRQDQQQATPHTPFFLYFATGAMHAPHHGAPEWIERVPRSVRRRMGARGASACSPASSRSGSCPGTTLTERPTGLARLGRPPGDEQRLYARQMEVFAGFLAHTDPRSDASSTSSTRSASSTTPS